MKLLQYINELIKNNNKKILEKQNEITGNKTDLQTKNKENLVDAINEVFINVTNGKDLIASSISDKGVETSNEDTFEVMAQNISRIMTSNGNSNKISKSLLEDLIESCNDIDINEDLDIENFIQLIKKHMNLNKQVIDDTANFNGLFFEKNKIEELTSIQLKELSNTKNISLNSEDEFIYDKNSLTLSFDGITTSFTKENELILNNNIYEVPLVEENLIVTKREVIG